jgi:hypothetical protein
VDAYLMRAGWIFASVDSGRPRGGQPEPDRPAQKSRLELLKEEAALRGFEAKSKLEDTDPFGELAIAALVLPRVKAPIVEGPKPPLPVDPWRDDEPCVGRIALAR